MAGCWHPLALRAKMGLAMAQRRSSKILGGQYKYSEAIVDSAMEYPVKYSDILYEPKGEVGEDIPIYG